jgi:hypothetical protein
MDVTRLTVHGSYEPISDRRESMWNVERDVGEQRTGDEALMQNLVCKSLFNLLLGKLLIANGQFRMVHKKERKNEFGCERGANFGSLATHL